MATIIHVISFCFTHVRYNIIMYENMLYLLGQYYGTQSISADFLAQCFGASFQYSRH